MAEDTENTERTVADDKKQQKQLNVRISPELYKKLDSINEPKGLIVTKALERYLNEETNKDANTGLSSEYVDALLKQMEIKDEQIKALSEQLKTKDDQIAERDNTTKMHVAQVQTLINQLEKKQLELEGAIKKKWYHFWK